MAHNIAFVFPGQGSQVVGMGSELAAEFPEVARRFDEANEILGFDLKRMCFEGPEEELQRTENTQPALLTVSYAFYELLRAHTAFEPAMMAGHSLGEYTALVAAGAMDFPTALRTVRERGRLMEAAVPEGRGGMAAIIGLTSERVAELCATARAETGAHVEPATLNAPEQTVVAGEKEAIARLVALAQEAGAQRAVELRVSGPFHSRLLADAGRRLGETLATAHIAVPAVPVVANVTAQPVESAEAVRTALIDQVSSPVRWVETVQYMVAQGVDTILEIGPGRVLSGLIRRIDRSITTYQFDNPKSWAKVLAWIKGVEVR